MVAPLGCDDRPQLVHVAVVVLDRDEPATRSQDAGDLPDGPVEIAEVVEDAAAHDDVELSVGERQLVEVAVSRVDAT